MSLIDITPGILRGEFFVSRTLVFNKRCVRCQKKVRIGFWFVHTHKKFFRNGSKAIEWRYYCPQEPDADPEFLLT